MIPPRGINKFRGQKKTITSSKNEIKKLFLGEEIKQKETQMGPHRGSQDDPATGNKTTLTKHVSSLTFFSRNKGQFHGTISVKLTKT